MRSAGLRGVGRQSGALGVEVAADVDPEGQICARRVDVVAGEGETWEEPSQGSEKAEDAHQPRLVEGGLEKQTGGELLCRAGDAVDMDVVGVSVPPLAL